MPSPPTPLVDALRGPQGAGEPPGLAEARAFLDGNSPPRGLSPEIADALCQVLAERSDAARLSQLAAGSDKALAKRARRGLHLLRARGVQAEIPVGAAAPVAHPVEAPVELESLLSVSLRDGERMLWYLRPAENGVEVHQARMTEVEGLTRFEVALPTRREWREAEGELIADDVLEAVRVPASYARWILEEAWQQASRANRVAPRKYAEVRHLLPRPEEPARHPGLETPPSTENVVRVLALPETRSWIPDEEMARKAYLEIEVVATSALMVDERQRAEQVAAILLRCCNEALAGEWRKRLQRRLLDTAYLITRLPTRPHHDRARDYAADAAICVAAANQVADSAIPVEEQRIARGLFERLIPKETLPVEPKTPAGSLIVTP
jgi:hypothetical protein